MQCLTEPMVGEFQRVDALAVQEDGVQGGKVELEGICVSQSPAEALVVPSPSCVYPRYQRLCLGSH